MAFRELRGTGGSNFFKWPNGKYGTEFVGQFKALATGDYQGKTTFHAVINDAQGKTVKVNTPTILRDKLTEVQAGEFVRIVYTGDQPGKGAKTGAKEFSVVAGPTLADVQQAQAAPAPQAQPASNGGVSAEALAAAMALLKGQQPQAAQSPYDALIAKLRAQDPKGSDALIKALEQIYPDAAAREQALADHLKAQGVAV